MSFEKFADGCHRYGWIINVLVSLFLIGTAWGSLNSSVSEMKTGQTELRDRINRVENILICGNVYCR